MPIDKKEVEYGKWVKFFPSIDTHDCTNTLVHNNHTHTQGAAARDTDSTTTSAKTARIGPVSVGVFVANGLYMQNSGETCNLVISFSNYFPLYACAIPQHTQASIETRVSQTVSLDGR